MPADPVLGGNKGLPPTSSDTVLGGNKGLPPVELAFVDWINDATTVVVKPTSTNKTAQFLTATATKKTKAGVNVLEITAIFGVTDTSVSTVTGTTSDDKSAFKISDPDDPPAGSRIGGPIDNLSKLKSPWDIWAGNKKLLNYVSFKLFRYDTSTLVANKRTDQAYYEFFDSGKKSLGLFAAIDGKEITK